MRASSPGRAHVLTLTDTIGFGGAEQLVLLLTESLDSQRFRRTVCLTRQLSASDPSDEYHSRTRVERLRRGGIGLLELPRRSSLNLAAWLRLIRFIRTEGVDVIHAHKFGSNFWGVVIGKLTRVSVIIAHEHTWSFEGQPLRRWIDREIIGRFADAVIAVSEADRRRMIGIERIPAERIVFIPNGIPPLPPGDGSRIRREAGVARGEPVLVSVANLRPQKAHDVMIRAYALVQRSFPTVRLLIAGGGDTQPLQALAAELNVSAGLRFLGARRDIADVLAAGDVAVSSSDFEGSPLAAMEYLAAGLPVVATDVGGMSQLVRDGHNGMLVPRRDPVALAAAIGELLGDPARARQMGDRGRQIQREQFSLDAMARRVEALYTERLGAKRNERSGPTRLGCSSLS